MLLGKKEFTFDRVVRLSITVIIIAAIYLLFKYLQGILTPFIIALALAYILNPIVLKFQHLLKLKGRGLAVFLTLLVTFILFGGFFAIFIPVMVREFGQFGDLIQAYFYASDTHGLPTWIPEEWWVFFENFFNRPEIQAFFQSEDFSSALSQIVQKSAPQLWDIFNGAISIIVGVFVGAIIILYLIFLLADWDHFYNNFKNMIPPSLKGKTIDVFFDFKDAMNRYFRAQSLVALVNGICFIIGFKIMGLPMAVLLGVLLGILNLIPYLQNIGIIPAALLGILLSLETGTSLYLIFIYLTIIFLSVQIIEKVALTPLILGKAMKMNSAIVLLALLVWGKLLGFAGMILALPLTYMLTAYYKTYIIDRDHKDIKDAEKEKQEAEEKDSEEDVKPKIKIIEEEDK